MTDLEKRSMHALALMCKQYMCRGHELDHERMGAGERACKLLFEGGFITHAHRGSEWTDAGRKLLKTDVQGQMS